MRCTYTEYLEQPAWFTELYKIKLETEAEYQQKQDRSAKRRR